MSAYFIFHPHTCRSKDSCKDALSSSEDELKPGVPYIGGSNFEVACNNKTGSSSNKAPTPCTTSRLHLSLSIPSNALNNSREYEDDDDASPLKSSSLSTEFVDALEDTVVCCIYAEM